MSVTYEEEEILEVELLEIEDEEVEEKDEAINEVANRWNRFYCAKTGDDHLPIYDEFRKTYVCKACKKSRWTGGELETITNKLLREDSNAELCRKCVDVAKLGAGKTVGTTFALDRPSDDLPYGKETGHVEWQIQKDKEGNILLDDADQALYVGYPELQCDKGHTWYKGEGPRRNINGKNPILFETHLYNRTRREIQVKDGIPDPAYTMDRWGKHPIQGMYNRAHPDGRKMNTEEQRKRHGASFYR